MRDISEFRSDLNIYIDAVLYFINFSAVNNIYSKYFQHHQPARAAFQVHFLL